MTKTDNDIRIRPAETTMTNMDNMVHIHIYIYSKAVYSYYSCLLLHPLKMDALDLFCRDNKRSCYYYLFFCFNPIHRPTHKQKNPLPVSIVHSTIQFVRRIGYYDTASNPMMTMFLLLMSHHA